MAILTSFTTGKSHQQFSTKAKLSNSKKAAAIHPCRDFNKSTRTGRGGQDVDYQQQEDVQMKRKYFDNRFLEATSSSSTSLRSDRTKRAVLGGGWWWACVLFSLLVIFSSTSFTGQAEAKHAWERPGCHKVGHTRKVTIPECVEFTITTNACRGYCESFAVPSAWYRLQNNPSQAITSVGQCCNIMETEDVTVSVMCVGGQRELVFKSAKSCACYHCKKD